MTITRAQVAANAHGYADRGTWFGPGHCLMFARMSAEAPGGVYDARDSWYGAGVRYVSADWRTWPAGTFGYGAIGDHDHVWVNAGDGYCYSTDVFRVGRVDRVLIGDLVTRWHMPLRGWKAEINGVTPTYDVRDWFDMADKADLRDVVDNALAAALTADNPALMNAVRVAIEAERQEDAQAVVAEMQTQLAADTDLRSTFRNNVRVPVDAELTQRNLGKE